MKKKLILILAVLAVLGIALYTYVYKGHRDISSEEAMYAMTVKELQRQFSEQAFKANQKYADKTIQITGKITSIDQIHHTIIIDEKLSAVLQDSILKVNANGPVKIKGRFIGYDDLLEEFKMDQVSIDK